MTKLNLVKTQFLEDSRTYLCECPICQTEFHLEEDGLDLVSSSAAEACPHVMEILLEGSKKWVSIDFNWLFGEGCIR